MGKIDLSSLEAKRLEVIENLIRASEAGRIEWEALGNSAYYAQANKMAVRVSVSIHSTTKTGAYKLEIIDSDGDTLDEFIYADDSQSETGIKMAVLYSMVISSMSKERARDLDRFLEDLRA